MSLLLPRVDADQMSPSFLLRARAILLVFSLSVEYFSGWYDTGYGAGTHLMPQLGSFIVYIVVFNLLVTQIISQYRQWLMRNISRKNLRNTTALASLRDILPVPAFPVAWDRTNLLPR
jgi:membrane protein YdbS with pleckstrin-like domain